MCNNFVRVVNHSEQTQCVNAKELRIDQGWLKSVILGRGSSYKDLIFFGHKSRGGLRLAKISIQASYKAKLY